MMGSEEGNGSQRDESDLDDQMRALGLDDEDIAAWRSSRLAPESYGDWITDRIARRPSGSRAKAQYGGETIHDFARTAILGALALGPADQLLDIGCGGGLLLRDAMRSGAKATGLDHSPDMVDVARERAPGAQVVLARAEELPFPDRTFTAVSMSVVFFFLDDPASVLHECHRVLHPDGRLAIFGSAPEMRGTGAAPEPIASQVHWYDDDQLAVLVREAGFRDVHVIHQGGAQLLTARR
jgi:SAM-dependent methyltransferase